MINSNKKKTRVELLMIGDQVLLETPEILRKLSTPRTVPYPVTNVYKDGTIRIKKYKNELYQKH
jgi:hypothetical protein